MKRVLSRVVRWLFVFVVVSSSWGVSASAQDADCSTPRRAVVTWLGNLQSDNDRPAVAVQCFDWDGASVRSRHQRETLARQLKAVLDQRGHYIDVDALADTEEVDDEALQDGKVILAERLPSVYLEQVDSDWLLSAETVRVIADLHRETFAVDVESFVEDLPAWMRIEVIPSLEVWQLVGILAAIFLGLLVRLVLSRLLQAWARRVLSMRGQSADADVLRRTVNPIGTLALTGVVWWFLPLLRMNVRANQIGNVALRVMAATATMLLLYRLVDLGADVFARRAAKTETKFDDQIVPLVRKTLKVFVVVVGVIFVLQNLDVDVASLLAGVSLGGLAFTLAAKDTVANLFGSVSIFADQPFQIGDWVVIDGHEGVVEEVGMRSTRVRTFYGSVISIPNSIVANAAIDNYGMRRYRRCMVTLGLTYDTSPDQIQAFVEGIRAILQANPSVRQDAYEVSFRNFGDSALEILLYFFFQVPTWSEELAQRQNVFLEIMRLAKTLNVDFAFPTQTLHVETMATAKAIDARESPARAKLTSMIESFAAGGSASTPESALLTEGYFPVPQKAGSDDEVDFDAGEG